MVVDAVNFGNIYQRLQVAQLPQVLKSVEMLSAAAQLYEK